MDQQSKLSAVDCFDGGSVFPWITNEDGSKSVLSQKMFSGKINIQNSDGTSSVIKQGEWKGLTRSVEITHSDGTNTSIRPNGFNPLKQSIHVTNTDKDGNVI
ncbi:hypothetical protein BGZ72_000536 [Mortierella alpina]|nr:hypothetical protein BGZ72_000536 [Mortierella alpina]